MFQPSVNHYRLTAPGFRTTRRARSAHHRSPHHHHGRGHHVTCGRHAISTRSPRHHGTVIIRSPHHHTGYRTLTTRSPRGHHTVPTPSPAHSRLRNLFSQKFPVLRETAAASAAYVCSCLLQETDQNNTRFPTVLRAFGRSLVRWEIGFSALWVLACLMLAVRNGGCMPKRARPPKP